MKPLHLAEERLTARPPSLAELAADEIERLDAVGAFVDHRDARIAHELLHAVLGDIAVAAEHLLRHHRVGEAHVGEHALDAPASAGPCRSSAAWRAFASPERCATSPLSAVHITSARAASLKARIVISVRRTSGCTMIGSAGLSGAFGPGQRAALQALACA